MTATYKKGAQIVYTNDNLGRDCKYGFVVEDTSSDEKDVLCRFWDCGRLERIALSDIVFRNSIPQGVVDAWLERMGKENDAWADNIEHTSLLLSRQLSEDEA